MFAFYYLDTKATRALDETTEELTKTLSEAMYDVATGSDWDFDSEMSRKTFITNFTNRLSASLGYDATEDTKEAMMQKVPAIILAGNSCFYIYYTGTYNSGGVTYVSKAFSPRIPYTDVYGNYAVSFSFDGQIKVEVNGSADIYQGLYYDVYAQLGSPAALNFMATEKDYVTTVSLLATRLIEQNFEMMADKGLIGENSDKSYVFSIPAGETGFLRTVTGPCAIAMYQGNTMQITTGEMINAYSFVAADLQQRGSYVVLLETNPTDGSTFLTYHREGCTHSGSRIMKGTMQECAGHGAYPCPDCIVCK